MAVAPEQLYQLYLNHYRAQSGGRLPVFHGVPYQKGHGLGDILRGLFRFLAPVASAAASTFIKESASNIEAGKSLKESAKSSLLPALASGVDRTITRFVTGKGKRKGYKKAKKRCAKKAKYSSTNF